MDYNRKIELGQKMWHDGLQELFDAVVKQYEIVIAELQAKNEVLHSLCLELAAGQGKEQAEEIVARVLERAESA